MSRIDKLIAELCPEGVELKTLGEFSELVRGNGMPKSDFAESGVGCIHYGQIHTYYGVWATETISFVQPKKAVSLTKVEPNDIIITNTSENIENACKAVAWLGDSQIVTGEHATVIKHQQNAKYLSYYFRTPGFFAQKRKIATCTKVVEVSAKSLAKVRVPVPPLEIQREIVKILDTFTKLEAELEAELEARQRQYRYYCDALLTFDARTLTQASKQASVRWTTLGEVASIGTGSRNTNEAIVGGPYPFFVRSQEPLAIDEYEFNEAAIITAGDGVGVGKVFHFVEGKYALHQRAYRIAVASNNVLPKFLFHFVRNDFSRYLATTSVHASVTSLRKPMFEKYPVPVPPLGEQERIVAILDKFDALVNDLLPAEIKARRQQYEHYRKNPMNFSTTVKRKPLGEIASLRLGRSIAIRYIKEHPGPYPVISGGRTPLGYTDVFNVEDDPIGIVHKGSIGVVTWTPGRYFRNSLNFSCTVADPEQVDPKFLYHYLNQAGLEKLDNSSTVPTLGLEDLSRVLVPIPSIEEQRKVVRVLDHLLLLEEDLRAEINARQKQYEYYRDKLLTFQPKTVTATG